MSHTRKYCVLALFLLFSLQACSQTPQLATQTQQPVCTSQWWASDFVPHAPSLDGVFGKAASSSLLITGDYLLETDAIAGDLLLAPEGQTIAIDSQPTQQGPRHVRALVRFQPSGPQSTFAFSLDSSVRLQLTADKPSSTLTTSLQSPAQASIRPSTLALRAFNQFGPLSPHDNPALAPALADKWTQIRAELQKGSIRVWIDDRLVVQQSDPTIDPALPLRLSLAPGAQLAQFASTPIPQIPATTLSALNPARSNTH